MRTILVPGSFDVFHMGHLQMLRYLAEYGEVHIALGTDEYQEEYKRKPVQTFNERMAMLEMQPEVKAVHARDKQTIEGLFQTYDFDAIACGGDWIENGIKKFLNLSGLSEQYLRKHNIHLLVVPNHREMSTTRIIEKSLESVS